MHTRMMGVAVGMAVALSVPSHAQDVKATEILAKTRQAIGGTQIDALKTLTVEATVQRNVNNMQMSGDAELNVEIPDKYVRTEVAGRMGIEMNTGFNGEKAILPAGASMSMAGGGGMMIRIGPGGPMPEGPKPTPEQLEQLNRGQVRMQRSEISRLMLGWFGMAHPALEATYTYAGEAESPDGKAHVIEVKDADGFSARLFVDQNNFLPLMVTYQGRQPRMVTSTTGPRTVTRAAGAGATVHGERREPTEDERKKLQADMEKEAQQAMAEQPLVDFSIFFDDWRQVDGIQFPHVLRRASAGTTNEEWTIRKVKVNPRIDPRKFSAQN